MSATDGVRGVFRRGVQLADYHQPFGNHIAFHYQGAVLDAAKGTGRSRAVLS